MGIIVYHPFSSNLLRLRCKSPGRGCGTPVWEEWRRGGDASWGNRVPPPPSPVGVCALFQLPPQMTSGFYVAVKSEGCVAGISPETSFTPDTSSSLKPESTEHTQGHSHSLTDSKTTANKETHNGSRYRGWVACLGHCMQISFFIGSGPQSNKYLNQLIEREFQALLVAESLSQQDSVGGGFPP